MAQEWILKKGDGRFDSCCLGTSFKDKLDQVQRSIRPQRHHCVDFVEMPLKQYNTLSVDERSLPRGITLEDVQEVWDIECTDKWYDHQPLPIAENGEVRIT